MAAKFEEGLARLGEQAESVEAALMNDSMAMACWALVGDMRPVGEPVIC